MKHDEIIKFVIKRKIAMNISDETLSRMSSVSRTSVERFFCGENINTSSFLSILNVLGVEYEVY